MTLLLVFLPLVNFFSFLFFGRFVSTKRLATYTVISIMVVFFLLLAIGPSLINGVVRTAHVGVWLTSGLFETNWNFSIDALTYTMLIVVFAISTLVHLYSTEYISEDPHLPRFISYLSLFTFFMLILITSDNFIGLFLGWEGVGLCSYLLISFWFTRIQANKAAIQAMIVNRLADLTFTVGVLVTFYTFQSVEFSVVFGLAPFLIDSTVLFGDFVVHPLPLLCTLLFLGACGKSAQIGLHTWLPSAIEGPTPVSALIHAATIVTAGVFLIIRCSALFETVPGVLVFITFMGASTAFMAATAGLVQNDLKKVVAYSTCSQLGYIVYSCGLSAYALSLFHLANHAFFKALLFLSAGAVIHSLSNEQDLRKFGGLARVLPYSYAMFLVGSLALIGFPFLTGFYSKDIILETAAATLTISGVFSYWLGLTTAIFTAFYSFRLLQLAFYGNSRTPRPYLILAHESSGRIAAALATLSLGSIFLGYLGRDLFIGFGTPFWNGSIYNSATGTGKQIVGEFLALYVKLGPVFGSIIAVSLVFTLFGNLFKEQVATVQENKSVREVYRFLSHKWYFDTVYNRLFNQPILEWAYNTVFGLIDKGLLETAGPTGLGNLSTRIGAEVAAVQTGRVFEYAWVMLGTLYIYTISLGLIGPDLFELAFLLVLRKRRQSAKRWILDTFWCVDALWCARGGIPSLFNTLRTLFHFHPLSAGVVCAVFRFLVTTILSIYARRVRYNTTGFVICVSFSLIIFIFKAY